MSAPAKAPAATISETSGGVALGPLEQIPLGGARAFAVDFGHRQDQVAVFRLRSGTLRAVSAVCPHRGGPIADGQSDETQVLCPLHLNAFDLATGCSTTGATALVSYPVRTDADGTIVVAPPTS